MGRLNPLLLVPVRHLGSPCAADDDLSAAYAARDINPEMKGMAGAEEGAQQESDMAYVIMLNSDTWWYRAVYTRRRYIRPYYILISDAGGVSNLDDIGSRKTS